MNSRFVPKVVILLIISSLLWTQPVAATNCDETTMNLEAILSIYKLDGSFVTEYDYDFVGDYCITKNLLMPINDDTLLFQNEANELSEINIDAEGLISSDTSYEVADEDSNFNYYDSIVNTTIFNYAGGGEFVGYNYDKQSRVSVEYDTEAILNASSLSLDNFTRSDNIGPVLKMVVNYNDHMAFAYIETDYNDDNNKFGVFRSVIIHNALVDHTYFISDFTNFTPRFIKLSPDGYKMVMYDILSGIGVYDFSNDNIHLYTMDRNNDFPVETIRFVSIQNDYVWMLTSDNKNSTEDNTPLMYIRKMNVVTGEVTRFTLDLPSEDRQLSNFIVHDGFILILSNQPIFGFVFIRVAGFLLVFAALFLLQKRRNKNKKEKQKKSGKKDYSKFLNMENKDNKNNFNDESW
ncbi:MAG: hypothetical protein INQ03_22800 [Candidatus Heimdallarchaeota archaeon]|nr:hypothetical protein [Candidatus Heimdallarchaeota archaeon]